MGSTLTLELFWNRQLLFYKHTWFDEGTCKGPEQIKTDKSEINEASKSIIKEEAKTKTEKKKANLREGPW